MIRLFIVQMQCGDDTRFLGEEADFVHALHYANNNVAEGWSKGTRPKVEVLQVEGDPERRPLTAGQLAALILKK
jgi:hypothetical protein